MRITLEIKSLKDWEILLPLLNRLKIKIIETIPSSLNKKEKKSDTNYLKQPRPSDIFQLAGVLSEKEASIFETAIIESRKINLHEW